MDTQTTLAPMSSRIAQQLLPSLPTDLGLTWRSLHVSDAQNLFELITLIERADESPFRTSLEETTELFDGEWKHFDTDSIAAVNELGQIIAYGVLEMPPGDESMSRVLLDGGVHPEARDVGLGQAVVNWLTARAKNMLREADTKLPGRVATYLQDNTPQHWVLFETQGYSARRFYKSLQRDLSHPVEAIALESHLRLVPFDDSLDNAVRLAHNDAFRDHWGSEPQTRETWVQGRSMFMPQWSFAVIDTSASHEGNEPLVAGYILVDKYEQDWVVVGHSSGYIHSLGVRRKYRGQKIALSLLTAVMRKLKIEGIEYAELDVDSENPSGAFGMYTSLGFEESSSSRMYSLEF